LPITRFSCVPMLSPFISFCFFLHLWTCFFLVRLLFSSFTTVPVRIVFTRRCRRIWLDSVSFEPSSVFFPISLNELDRSLGLHDAASLVSLVLLTSQHHGFETRFPFDYWKRDWRS
jgi:hypothetical protein